jgi:hypothetical protein
MPTADISTASAANAVSTYSLRRRALVSPKTPSKPPHTLDRSAGLHGMNGRAYGRRQPDGIAVGAHDDVHVARDPRRVVF